MIPYYRKDGITIIQGGCLDILKELPDECVHMCVTSPPYWGLRDYGVEGQIGLEPTPEEYVARMVEIFREVRRVLRGDGTLWLNLGDSYIASASGSSGRNSRLEGGKKTQDEAVRCPAKLPPGLQPKNLVGIPWRVAFALQTDGWYLRQDIIWHKPNPMPESVRDRCTKSHEYLFLLSKNKKYYYDNEAIKEPCVNTAKQQAAKRNKKPHKGQRDPGGRRETTGGFTKTKIYAKRNRRDVWAITTKPYKGAHFAAFPPDLVEPCIKAGCPKGGIVLDPFLGSGTTARVSKDLGRKCIGSELNQEFCDLAIKRIEKK